MVNEPPKTIPQGAATTLYCALSPDIVPGEFYMDCRVETGPEARRHVLSSDEVLARKLWEASTLATKGCF